MGKRYAAAARRRAFEPTPGVARTAPRQADDLPPGHSAVSKYEWPPKPKTAGRKAKKIRVSAAEAADALERRH
jgi:hypothetical protein